MNAFIVFLKDTYYYMTGFLVNVVYRILVLICYALILTIVTVVYSIYMY